MTRPDLPVLRTNNDKHEAAQLAGLNALKALANSRPLPVTDAATLMPPKNSYRASTREGTISAPRPVAHPRYARRRADSSPGLDRRDPLQRAGDQDLLAPVVNPLGRLTATLVQVRFVGLFVFFLIGVAAWSFQHLRDIDPDGLAPVWIGLSVMILIQQVLAWSEAPVRIRPAQEARLDQLNVTVSIPVYNEDPAALLLVAQSMVKQTRPPRRVEFVDDGSDKFDYRDVRAELAVLAWRYPDIDFSWVRTERTADSGKRAAQAVTFGSDRRADIFATIDSDTILDPRAIEEGLKPFADPRVTSVAAVLLTYNSGKNLLTALTEIWLTVYQLGIRSAWSRLGRVMINSGGLAFYRASVVREALPAYLNETFFGRPVRFSDDSMLTFFAMLRGRTVQQPTCFAFTIMPEKISHHIRQQLRWMRGNIVRSFWWFRYLSPLSLGWWLAITAWISFALTTGLILALFVITPIMHRTMPPTPSFFFVLVISYVVSLRALLIRRSDQRLWMRLAAFACVPLISLWGMTVLRVLRLYSLLTCLEASWGTRKNVEVTLANGRPG
jgi:hyaluronan synthase